MLLIVAWLSRRARTMPFRWHFSSVTPALSIATLVPDPIAMPTSHPVARHGDDPPLGLQSSDWRPLPVGQDLDLVDVELPSARLGGDVVVAGQHHDPDPYLAQRGDRQDGRTA